MGTIGPLHHALGARDVAQKSHIMIGRGGNDADSVITHIESLCRDLAASNTDHFTDTDWWISEWWGCRRPDDRPWRP